MSRARDVEMPPDLPAADPSRAVSEREAVMRERAAYLVGSCKSVPPCIVCVEDAARLYALPKVSRPTVVRDPHDPRLSWRYIEPAMAADPGASLRGFETRDDEGSKRFASVAGSSVTYWPTPRRVQMWAALLAHPVELVVDDGSAGGAS